MWSIKSRRWDDRYIAALWKVERMEEEESYLGGLRDKEEESLLGSI